MANEGVVKQRGTDSSGRPIYMTNYMADFWEAVVADLGFRPVITQGAWMARVPGGGAENSAGFPDAGGCLDWRTWNLTTDQSAKVVRTIRRHGAGAWRRYKSQGMSEDHGHLVLGTDPGISVAALGQWREYLAGGDGLSGDGKDYEWRPNPLVLEPPEGDDMGYTEDELTDIIRGAVRAELANAGETIKLDVGKPRKWSLETVAATLLGRGRQG